MRAGTLLLLAAVAGLAGVDAHKKWQDEALVVRDRIRAAALLAGGAPGDGRRGLTEVSISPTPSTSSTPSPSRSASASPSPSSSPIESATPTSSATGTSTQTPTQTGTRTPSETASVTRSMSVTRSPAATGTGTRTETATGTGTPSHTATGTATMTRSLSSTRTPASTPNPTLPPGVSPSASPAPPVVVKVVQTISGLNATQVTASVGAVFRKAFASFVHSATSGMDRARILITAITDLATGRRRTVAPDDPMNSDERRRVLEAAAMAVDSGAGAHARVLQGGSGISVDFGIAIPPTSVAGDTTGESVVNAQVALANTALASLTTAMDAGDFSAATTAALAEVAALAGVDPNTLTASVDMSSASVYVPPSRGNTNTESRGLSSGAIAGLAVGAVVGGILFIGFALWAGGVIGKGSAAAAGATVPEWGATGGAAGTAAAPAAEPATGAEGVHIAIDAPAPATQAVTVPAAPGTRV